MRGAEMGYDVAQVNAAYLIEDSAAGEAVRTLLPELVNNSPARS